MSDFKFERKLTEEEQRELSADDQKKYIKGLLKSQGHSDAEVEALDDNTHILPTVGGADPADSPGALPPREERPPAATQTVEEDHSDLPPSIRGELGDLNEPPVEDPPAEDPPVEDPPAEDPPVEAATEGPPEESYLEVNDQTTYKTKEDAIKGIDEKDRTIKTRDEELRLAKQEAELAVREAESLRARMEAETQAAALDKEPPTEDLPPELPPVPTAQELYAIYDDEEKGPLEAMKIMMPHLLQDIQPLIDMAQRLNTMGADKYLNNLMAMKTVDIIQGFHEDHIYESVDSKFPEFEGKWRDPDDPIGKEYARTWHEIDQSYVQRLGHTLTEISERSPESVQWAIEEVLTRMEAPSENGSDPQRAATTDPPEVPAEPPHTDGADKGETDKSFTREEAKKLAEETAAIAVNAVTERNKIHGQAQTESPGAKKSQPGETKTEWTPEMIKKDPTGWAKAKRSDPNYSKATLDLLPQVRE